jgi:hypothetical protein
MHIKFVNARVPASTQLLNYIQTSLGQLDMYFNRVLPLETYDECYLPVYVLYDNNGKYHAMNWARVHNFSDDIH